MVDAVGGITLDINQRVPIGGGGSKVSGYIEPGRNVHLDGYHALWFARSRHDSSDYARIARQKCVMNAMLNQLDPVTVLTNFNKIAGAGQADRGYQHPDLGDQPAAGTGAVKARKKPIASVALVPPLIYPGSPNVAKMHSLVQKKIAELRGHRPAAESPVPNRAPAPSPEPARPRRPRRPRSPRRRRPNRARTPTTSDPSAPLDDLG